ncbi:MAG TPA: acyl-CoA dehydrogenase family protein, partial [Chloroflexota bacterium]|nr:acyl-CoA dehydrogenase family protein [Chloroflexota bacterium]
MRFTSDHDLFRQTVREFLTREINPRVEEWEQAQQFPAHEVLPSLAQLGLLGLEYDAADGGQGADHWYTVIFGEELGRIPCGGVPMAIA